MSIPKYLAMTVSSSWLVIPFALWLVLIRVLVPDNSVLQLSPAWAGADRPVAFVLEDGPFRNRSKNESCPPPTLGRRG